MVNPCVDPNLYLSLLDLDIQYRAQLDRDPDVDKVKVVTQCYSSIETSSNISDIYKMTNGETASFWQSDGSARSHWIRQGHPFVKRELRLRPHCLDMNMINFKVETCLFFCSQIENETRCSVETTGHCCGF